MSLPPKLQTAPVSLTVRELLGLFGRRNRDFETVGLIESELSAAGLCCDPPLHEGGLSSQVTVRAVAPTPEAPATASEEEPDEEESLVPVAPRVGDLPSARLGERLIRLGPGDDLDRARTLMMHHNYSQLPVLDGPTVLKGMVSWETIARAYARGRCEELADATRPAQEVSIDAGLLTVIPDVCAGGQVFVRDESHEIGGIVTAADLAQAFDSLSGPFLLLGELERRLRQCVDRMCPTVADLRDASGHKKATASYELTVFQIEEVFKKPDRWAVLGWGISQDYFLEELQEIRRQIRNAVAHYRPHPLTGEQLTRLERFAGMVRELQP